MTTISQVKKSGEKFLSSVSSNNKTILVFAHVGLSKSTTSGTERQFIQHVGAFSPAQKNGQFYKAVAGPELAQQMEENVENVKFMSKMKKLGYSQENNLILFSDAYQCFTPRQVISAMFSFISNLKKSQKDHKICFILKDEEQVKMFSKFFIPSFIKLDAKVKNFLCTSLDSILKSVRSDVDIESLPSLQSSLDKRESLTRLLAVRSDLLCLSLYESFCILVIQQSVLQPVMKSLLALTNDGQQQNQSPGGPQNKNQNLYQLKKEESIVKPDNNQSESSFNISSEEAGQDSFLLAESESSRDDSRIENDLREAPSLLKANALLISPSEISQDRFNPGNSTMFIQPIFYENVKWKSKAMSANPSSYTHLLYLECYVHPTAETFKVAIKPPHNLLRGDNINNEYFYEVMPNFTRYLGKDGTSLTCWTLKTTFDLLDSFITTSRKKHAVKQFNLFVKEFDNFKKMILIPEFKELLTRFDSIVTLYNKKTRSLARVPDLELSEMPNYLNTILAQDSSCVLHTEQVSNVYSGSLL